MAVIEAEHPAVVAVRARLEPKHTVSVAALLLRENVAAVIAVESNTIEKGTQTTYWPVIVGQVDGRWIVPDSISGRGSQRAPYRPRQELTAAPPRLMWDTMSSSGAPGSHGERPSEAWTVMMGRAALDGRVLTVVSDVETVSCPVGEDGLVAVLFRKSWASRPRLRMQTETGDVVALFNGEPGIPR